MTGPNLGRKRNGLFAAVCYRKRGLPLLSRATTHDELNSSQNRLEEAFIARLSRNLPDTISPLLLADRGFKRASLLRWLPEMPRHTGRTVDYVAPLKGNVHIQTADGYQGLLWNYPLRPGRYAFLPGGRHRSDGAVTVNLALYWGGGIGNPGIWRLRCRTPRWPRGIIASGCSRSSTFAMASSILRRSRERQLPRRGWGVCWWGCYWSAVCCCWRGDVRRGGSGGGCVRGGSWD